MNEMLAALERASVQGAIALAVVWFLCRIFRRLPANTRCWLWRLAFLKCLVGLFLALTVAVPILPATPPAIPSTPLPTEAAADRREPLPLPIRPGADPGPVAPLASGLAPSDVAPGSPALPPGPATQRVPGPDPGPRLPPTFWLTLIYVAGVAAGVVGLLVSGIRTGRLTRRAEVIAHPALPELASRFGRRRAPRVARSCEISSPLLALGTILLPAEPADDEPLMLAHELAHFRRRDLAWEWLGTLTQIVFWFHPLVWLARREERLTREQAADALALAVTAAPPADYARALLAASLRRNGRIPTLAVGAVEGGSRLRQRLEALTQPGLPRRRALALSGIALALAAVAFVPWKAVARQEQPTSPETVAAAAGAPQEKTPVVGVAAIAVTVRLPDGTPSPQSQVDVYPVKTGLPPPHRNATTDAEGRCRIEGLDPGVYQVSAWVSKDYISPRDARVEIPSRGGEVKKEVTLIRAGEITGRVTDAKGRPIKRLWVIGTGQYGAVTDGNGYYTLVVPPGKVRVSFQEYAFRTVVARLDQPAPLNVTLPTGVRNLLGRVYDSQGKPVRATIAFKSDVNTDSFPANEEGRFEWSPYFYVPSMATLYAHSETEGGFVTVTPGQEKPLQIRLSKRDAGQIIFHVTDSANKPIPELRVFTMDKTWGVGEGRAPLDGEGRYRLPVRPNAPHSVLLLARGFHPQYLSGPSGGEKITLAGGASKDFGRIVLKSATDTASGQVRDAQDKPLAFAGVQLKTESGEWEAKTDAEGRFKISGVVKGERCLSFWVLRTGDEKIVSWHRSDLVVRDDMGVITPTDTHSGVLPASSPKPTPTPEPPPALRGSLSGAVNAAAGQPVSNAKVSWVVPYNETYKIIAATTTDGQGAFSFTNVSNGAADGANTPREYWRLRLDGWLMVRAEGHGLGVRRVRYGTPEVKFQLTAPQTYTAVFRDTKGRPVAGLPVWADMLNNDHTFFRLRWLGYAGKTDARGEFRVTGMPQGDSVNFGFDQSRWSIADQQMDVNQRAVYRNGRTVFTLDTGHTVEGTVRLPDGKPAAQVFLHTNPESRDNFWSSKWGRANAQGRFKLMGLRAGKYGLGIETYRYGNAVAPPQITFTIPEGAATLRKDIALLPSARVIGRVTDTNGKAQVGADVSDGNNRSVTDKNGRYDLTVPPGPNRIVVEGRDPKTVNARADRPTTLNITVPVNSIAVVRGQVVDAKGQPVTGAQVYITGKRMASGATTDNQGKFYWKSRTDDGGPLSVYVARGTEGASLAVPPGDDTPLRLQLSQAAVGVLTGQVTDAAGKPIPGVALEMSNNRIGRALDRSPFDAEGRFRVAAHPDSPNMLRFRAKGYGTRQLPNLYDSLSASKVMTTMPGFRVKAGETRDLRRIVLVKGTDTATGRIRDPQGKPVSNAVLFFVTKSGEWEGKTNAKGEFTIPGVIKGERAHLFLYKQEGNSLRTWVRRGITLGEMGTISLTDQDALKPP